MIEILVYLFHTYADFSARPGRDVLANKLQAAGFAQPDVAATLEWLEALRPEGRDAPAQQLDPLACRIYTDDERARLGHDGIAFISFLEHNRMLDTRLRELIIERAEAFGDGPLNMERLKIIVLIALWSQDCNVGGLLLEELLSEADETMH